MAGSDSLSSVAYNASESTQDWPLSNDSDDTLIPSLTDVYRTFFDGKATWEKFLDKANNIPSGLWPADALSPYTTLAKVPGLPERLPQRHVLYGRPCWELPLDIGGTSFEEVKTNRSVSLVHGHRVIFPLSTECLIRCNICPDASSFDLSVVSYAKNSLAVLAVCLSYIFSVR